MFLSAARKALGINARRLLEYLEVEHMNHAGTENGNLIATHKQLREWGIPKSQIAKAIDQAEDLGFIEVQRGGRNYPSRYRLTYFADRLYRSPTNNWRRYNNGNPAPENRGNVPPIKVADCP